MTGSDLAVVKVGGSLFGWPEFPERLTACLLARHATEPATTTLLIAGGGPAADWVRSLDHMYRIGDEAAHRLALHALDLTALGLAALLPGSIVVDRLETLAAARNSRTPIILAPRVVLSEIDQISRRPLPASWDVTSDTIAARIAAHLGARCLVLLKRVSVPAGATLEVAAGMGVVDRIFPAAARSIPHVEIVNLRSIPIDCQVLAR